MGTICYTCVVIDFINQNRDKLDKLKEQDNIRKNNIPT